MRRTRFMSWLFLVLSMAYFMVPNFRYALEAPLANYWWQSQFNMEVLMAGEPRTSRLENLFTLKRYATAEQMLALAEEANRKGDSDFVAFAALNLPESGSPADVTRLADEAVHANSQLTWIYYFLDKQLTETESRIPLPESAYAQLRQRAQLLQAFDPNNAVPHLLAAHLIQAERGEAWPQSKKGPTDPEFLDALAKETEWRKEMEAAFSAPRYDSYVDQHFDLFRRVLRQRHWDHPAVVLTLGEMMSIPNLLWLRTYTNMVVLKLGAEAEAKGRLNEAIETYRKVDEFGNRMRLQAPTVIERLMAVAFQFIAHQRLIPALRKAGKNSEADTLAYMDKQAKADLQLTRFTFSSSSHNDWSVFLVCLDAGLVAAFSLLTAFLVLYVNAKRWIRKDKKGRLFEILTTAENYAPILLFASSLSLYLNFIPYAHDYASAMTSNKPYSSFPPQFYSSIYPNFSLLGDSNFLAQITFMDYIPYALAGVLLLTVVTAVSLLRQASSQKLKQAQ